MSPCRVYRTPNGGYMTVRTAPQRPKKCRWCESDGGRLCDFDVGNGKTCDAPMCIKHADHIGFDRDHCPDHAGLQTVPERP